MTANGKSVDKRITNSNEVEHTDLDLTIQTEDQDTKVGCLILFAQPVMGTINLSVLKR